MMQNGTLCCTLMVTRFIEYRRRDANDLRYGVAEKPNQSRGEPMTIKPNDRNAELIAFFVSHCQGELGRTRLMKLLYLADYESRRFFGKPISQLKYIWHYYGPYDAKVGQVLEALKSADAVLEDQVLYPTGKKGYLYKSGPKPLESTFQPEESAILSYVCNRYSKTDLRELLDDVVYETEPMIAAKKADAREQPLDMSVVDGTRANELGLDFAEILRRSLDVRAGNFLTHSDAMKFIATELSASAA